MENLKKNLSIFPPKVSFRYLNRDYKLNYNGKILFRIVYNFQGNDEEYIGGWVETISNTSDNSIILNEAKVLGGSKVSGNAIVCDNAVVEDGSIVKDSAVVGGYATVKNHSVIMGDTHLEEKCVIDNSIVEGQAKINGDCYIVNNSHISGLCRAGNAFIENSTISGAVLIKDSPCTIKNSIINGPVTIGCGKYGDDYIKEVIIESSKINGINTIIKNCEINNANIQGEVTVDENNYYLTFSDIGSKYNDYPKIVYTKSNNRYFHRGILFTKWQLLKKFTKLHGFKGIMFVISLLFYKFMLSIDYKNEDIRYEEK